MKNKIVLAMSLGFIFSSAWAAETLTPAIAPENFRCEKNRALDLAAVKGKLLENCNLNKPYSVSYSDTAIGAEGTFFYCCHKR